MSRAKDVIFTRESDGRWCARIDGIPAAGIGDTQGEAGTALASCLSGFVFGRDETIEWMREHAQKMLDGIPIQGEPLPPQPYEGPSLRRVK